jgi:hypothetical protein
MRRMPTTILRSLAPTLAIGLTLSGCSYLTVKEPPTAAIRPRRFECTSSYAAPVMDLFLGSALGTIAALGVRGSAPDAQSPVFFMWFTPFSSSSIYGFIKVSHCNDALVVSQRSSHHRPTTPFEGPANE